MINYTRTVTICVIVADNYYMPHSKADITRPLVRPAVGAVRKSWNVIVHSTVR